jgi:glycosyltransferase involved in cell wall biosynthesis
MLKDKTIGVVIPAYNEEKLITKTLASMPDFLDVLVVVNDASVDSTAEQVETYQKKDERVILINHPENRGVGGAISTGYIYCRDHDIDVAVVMAGDNQMHPDDLIPLLTPVIENRTDYSKGNRLITGEAWKKIPRVRYLGNATLSFLTKIASGYWHIADSQTGYTALNKRALKLLPLEDIYPRYGMPNDFLVTLNIYNMRVMDVPVQPVYADEESKLKVRRVIFTLSFLLVKLFFRRMVQKYIIRDFHPLVLFYMLGIIIFIVDFFMVIRLFVLWSQRGQIPEITFLSVLFSTISGLQLLLFGMLFDMEANRDLKGTSTYDL